MNTIYRKVRDEGKVIDSLKPHMPENAVSLIEELLEIDPSARATILQVLTSPDLPQEENFQAMQMHLASHKNAMKLKLLKFLGEQETPLSLDLTYNIPVGHRQE